MSAETWGIDGCACPSREAQECAELRHKRRTGRWPEFPEEPCLCPCHGEPDDEDL